MQTNFKDVVIDWAEKKEMQLKDFQKIHIRDIERDLDRGKFDIDEAINKLDKIQDFPNLEGTDMVYIKKHIKK